MLFNLFLVFLVICSAAYFVFLAYVNTNSVLSQIEGDVAATLSREEIETLIEQEIEARVTTLINQARQNANFEEVDRYEKDVNSNTLPRLLKVVK